VESTKQRIRLNGLGLRLEETMQSSLHDIVQGLMVARLHANRMAEQWPHHAGTLKAFDSNLTELQRTLLKRLRQEGLYGREPYEVEEEPPVES
jgi:hypothetical protein